MEVNCFWGIEDDNTVTGLPHSEDKLSAILNVPRELCDERNTTPVKRRNIIDYDGKKVIYFSVDKGSRFIHQTSKGECFKREDREQYSDSCRFNTFCSGGNRFKAIWTGNLKTWLQ
jgi:ATP-dependent DNA helicase RecG